MSKTVRIIDLADVIFPKPVAVSEGNFQTPLPRAVFHFGEDPTDAVIIGMHDYACENCFPGGFQDETIPPSSCITSVVQFGFKPGVKMIETVIRVNRKPNLVGYVLSSTELGDLITPGEISKQGIAGTVWGS